MYDIALVLLGIGIGIIITVAIINHFSDKKHTDDFLPPVDVRHINKWD
jgi:predicted MFS family arabinose efflux permease